jgi:putative protease
MAYTLDAQIENLLPSLPLSSCLLQDRKRPNATILIPSNRTFDKFFMRLQHNSVQQGVVEDLSEDIVEVGHITHFFSKISVAVLELTAPLSVGDRILVKGPTTDFEQVVDSMQVEHKNIQRAEAGQSVGLKLAQQTKERDVVYRKL